MTKDELVAAAPPLAAVWRLTGVFLGYPRCCIDSFVALQHFGQPARKFNGIGFVPCALCNETKSEAQLIEESNTKRRATTPFMLREVDVQQEIVAYLDWLMEPAP